MSQPVIIDAGPAINFFATNNERLLLSVVGGAVLAPETVAGEVGRKSQADRRFAQASTVWARLQRAGRLEVLSDDPTPETSMVAQRLTGYPIEVRQRQAKDLGELMVIAHAVVRAEAGADVTVLIDDGAGARMATLEVQRLQARAASGGSEGSMRLVSTPAVLAAAAGSRWLPDRAAMRRVYGAIRACDDGLVDISQTALLSADIWSDL